MGLKKGRDDKCFENWTLWQAKVCEDNEAALKDPEISRVENEENWKRANSRGKIII